MEQTDSTAQEKGPDRSQSRQLAALAYFLVGLSGLLLLTFRRDDSFVRFHALQSVVATVAALILGLVLRILGILPLIGFLYLYLFRVYTAILFVYWIFLMLRAYQGARYKIPYLGNIVDRQVG
ncbi:MAG: DUF4870 domain-containing protein [Candidatus Eisenbacteria bacterium]|uniref:DUF4870 domain-containing protein n=1 Tax=Eiseniibacteriota bacterium TaxID=2212470 RepID=A0A956M2A3_UNCEI|nr:DUF4870 domain-containing protein [Candidatus Eisenbacteria bacterium]